MSFPPTNKRQQVYPPARDWSSSPYHRPEPATLGGELCPIVLDTMYKVLQGLDYNNLLLFKSGFMADAVLVMDSHTDDVSILNGINEIVTHTFNNIGPLPSSHILSGPRFSTNVPIFGKSVIKMWATVVAHCFPRGTRIPRTVEESVQGLMMGSSYYVEFVSSGGEWKIRLWDMKRQWVQGDPSILAPESGKGKEKEMKKEGGYGIEPEPGPPSYGQAMKD